MAMKKFKRQGITREDILNDKFNNAFSEGGFIDETLYETTDRDISKPYFDMLSNVYSMSAHNTILVAYKRVPYSEEIIQEEEFGKLSEKDIKALGGSTFGLTEPLDIAIYQCVWMKTPVSFGKMDANVLNGGKRRGHANYKIVQPKRAVEIMNTLKVIDEQLDGDYYVIPHVKEFLQNQLKKQDMTNLGQTKDANADLFLRPYNKEDELITTYIFVPLIKDGTYYEDTAGNKRYPYISEYYHYHKTRANQIKFHVKEVKKNGCVLVDSYFTVGKPAKSDEEIFVIKQYGTNFYNPFSFLESNVAERLYKKLLANPAVTLETLELIKATYAHYMSTEELRVSFGNAIPSIAIVESSVKSLKVNTPEDFMSDLATSDDDDCGIELDEDSEGEELIDDEEVARERSINTAKGYSTIDDNTVESIIMGHNGIRVFGYYSHLIEYYLRVFISSGSGKRNKRINLATKDVPGALQLIATINQNADLFMTNNTTHPFDAFARVMYKKYLYFTPKDKGKAKKVSKSTDNVNIKERYRDYDTEYGLIDAITVKSEETCGLVASVLPYKINENRFIVRNEEIVK